MAMSADAAAQASALDELSSVTELDAAEDRHFRTDEALEVRSRGFTRLYQKRALECTVPA